VATIGRDLVEPTHPRTRAQLIGEDEGQSVAKKGVRARKKQSSDDGGAAGAQSPAPTPPPVAHNANEPASRRRRRDENPIRTLVKMCGSAFLLPDFAMDVLETHGWRVDRRAAGTVTRLWAQARAVQRHLGYQCPAPPERPSRPEELLGAIRALRAWALRLFLEKRRRESLLLPRWDRLASWTVTVFLEGVC
jgi:hypothetical protein